MEMDSSGCGEGSGCESAGRSPTLLLLLPVLLSVVWVLFLLFYGSWFLALLLTKIANLFLSHSGIYIGSIHIHLLSGRLLFKDLHYYCRDYSVRVDHGYVSMGWWRSCCVCEGDVMKRTAFMWIILDGFEYHWYNRSEVYDSHDSGVDRSYGNEAAQNTGESVMWQWWKETQPSLHFSIKRGHILMGNHHLERSLVVQFARAETHYSMKEASTQYDELLHSVSWKATDVRVLLEKSHGYTGAGCERPPKVCEGTDEAYLLLRSDSAHVTFSQDSPGLVPLGKTPPPKYALDVTLGTNTVINYGCYANRQRKEIQAFFFPLNHEEQIVTRLPQAGERRMHSVFDISVTLQSSAEFNVGFLFKQSLQSLSIALATHSNVAIQVPWITTDSGSISSVRGQLFGVSVKSSLPYPLLGRAKDIVFEVDLQFPRLWNAVQKWKMKFSGQRVQANILFAYIDYVNALLDDWVGSEPNDLVNFVPVDWIIDVHLTQYEIFLFTNRYNWLDLQRDMENTRLAFCGATGTISFGLPFTEFIPMQQLIHFSAKGHDLVVRHYSPPSTATRESLFALSSANRYRWRTMERPSPQVTPLVVNQKPKEASSSNIGSCSLPSSIPAEALAGPSSLASSRSDPLEAVPLVTSHPQEHVITAPVIGGVTIFIPEQEDILPSPLLASPTTPGLTGGEEELVDKECFPMGCRDYTVYEKGWLDIACGPTITINIEYSSHQHDPSPGDHTPLLPNVLHVDVDAPVAIIRAFGCLARDLLGLKENYPGEYIKMTPFNSNSPSPPVPVQAAEPPLKEAPPSQHPDGPHPPHERTIDIFVSFKLRNIIAEFPTDLAKEAPRDFPLPSLCTDVLSVQVEYTASETKVQLHVDPLSIHVPSMVTTPPATPTHHQLGHVVINGLDLNCHGFTEFLCQERVEYSWKMQLIVGRITGAVSSLQLLIAIDWLYTTLIHTLSLGDGLQVAPDGELIRPKVEPISEDIKYRLFNLDIVEADLHICEDSSSIMRLQSAGLDLEFCTFHSDDVTLGLSWQLQGLTVMGLVPDPQEPTLYLKVGLLDLNPIHGDLMLREPMECVSGRQLHFLRTADQRTRRLWFLWRESDAVWQCGCCGGCLFMQGSVARKPIITRSQSAVYRPHFSPLTSVPRDLAMQGLNEELQVLSVSQVDCLRCLHRGLLTHYQARYADPSITSYADPSLPLLITSQLEERSSKVLSFSDDASFVSARSSLTSLLADDYKSVCETADEQVISKHKKKPSNLSIDMRANIEHGQDYTDSVDAGYQGIVGSQFLHAATLQIPHQIPQHTPTNTIKSPDYIPPVGHYRVHHRQSASDTSFMMGERHTSDAVPCTPCFHVYVPCLSQGTAGQLPLLAQKPSTQTLERRRRVHIRPVVADSEECTDLAKFSLSVRVYGANTVLLSPPFLSVITHVTKSVETFFQGRSAISILNCAGFSIASSVSSKLSALLPDNQPANHSDPPSAPILHLKVSMCPGSYLAVQLLQPSPTAAVKSTEPSRVSGKLSVIPAQKSLLTLYTSAVTTDVLVLATSEMRGNGQTEGEESRGEKEEDLAKVNRQCIKVSAELKFPVVQANFSALVESDIVDQLPGLVPGQQQLDFSLAVPAATGSPRPLVVCNLLEAGVKEANVALAARIVSSETSPSPILTWDNLQGAACLGSENSGLNVASQQVYASFSVPVLWCQLASPPCGLPDPTAGGIDILLLHDAIRAWQDPVHALKDRVTSLVSSKICREQQVLLTLIANAVQNQLLVVDKPPQPVLAELSVQYRRTVAFACLHQIWRALPIFSEIHVPTISLLSQEDKQHSANQLVALLLALVSNLYAMRGIQVIPTLGTRPSSALPGREADRCSTGTIGYVSISPSPSDMATPNRLYANRQYLEEQADVAVFSQVERQTLTLLREALVPLLLAIGVPMEHPPQFNTAHFVVDFNMDLRDVTLFVLDHLPSSSAPPPSYSTTPTLLAERLLLCGCIKHNSEVANTHSQNQPLLLLNDTAPSSKAGLLSNCCASMETIQLTVTAPLLKLAKHISVTGKLRRKAWKQVQLDQIDAMETPRPSSSAPPTSDVCRGVHVLTFASSLVAQLTELQDTADVATHDNGHQDSFPKSPNSAKLVDFQESPKTYKMMVSPAPVLPTAVAGTDAGKESSAYTHSSTYSSSDVEHSQSVSVMLENAPEVTSPSTVDTGGEDTTGTDSQHLVSSDNEMRTQPHSRRPSTASQTSMKVTPLTNQVESRDHTQSLHQGLSMSESELQFSVFVVVKLSTLKVELQVETTRAVLELSGISAAVDARNAVLPLTVGLPLLLDILPMYLSIAATLSKTSVRVSDRGLPDNDLIQLTVLPLYASIATSNCPPIVPSYRCLLKLTQLQIDIKQSAVKVHKRFQQLMPAFTKIYHDIFGHGVEVIPDATFSTPSSSAQQLLSIESVIKLPAKWPQGFIHLSLDKAGMFVAPLPSLNVTYTISPVSIRAQTLQTINFHLLIGDHKLRFNPKEQHKDELSLRFLALPRLHLLGNIRRPHKKSLPLVSLDLSIKLLNIDVTTDVLNQLLIIQNTFIKELNDLLQMLTSIGESLPTRERLHAIGQQRTEEGLSLISLLSSCRLSLAGIVITVSTPLATAIRFSTGKIEMTITNTSSQQWSWKVPETAKNQLSLDGRVEIDLNLALGYLQNVGPDVVDDLMELAYFRTRISVRNTLQNLPADSDAEQQSSTAVDTFLISIVSPHLYLQSSAVEQAILFWLNCKSVYSYWQNERKLLNIEVRKATDAFMEKFHRPAQFQTPSIDFSKPRLVQISVSDVGACMPIIPMSTAHNSTHKAFPAMVVTIKEMQFLLNLSHKVASTGRFQTFCIRFSDQFSLRQKIWTLDPRKHKLFNFGTITRGTFRLCMATKKRFSEKDASVVVGERLLCGFLWDMSGIDVHANTDIGHHMSTLVRTMTTIASDMEGQENQKVHRSTGNLASPKSQSARHIRKIPSTSKIMHKRSLSVHQRPSLADTNYKHALEQELAKQTRRVQQLRYSGAAGDNLRMEEAILRTTEQELSKTVQRMFRHPRSGLSLQVFNQIFSSQPITIHERLTTTTRTRLSSVSEGRSRGSNPSSPVHTGGQPKTLARKLGHRRYKSDVTGLRGTASPSPTLMEEKEEEEEAEAGDTLEEQPTEEGMGPPLPTETKEGFSLPSIDLEFNVTVNVDRGKIVLRTEESFDQRISLITQSPFLPTRHGNKTEHKHTVESVLLVPALTVKAHYQSLVGPTYSNRSTHTSPGHQSSNHGSPPPLPETLQPFPQLPIKRGVLSLSAVIESLPEDIKLTHSFLEFIEQVARPTLAATVISSSSSSESLADDSETRTAEEKPSPSVAPISFPVDVTLTFHINPSTVYLTCQPHSQVQCIIQSPDVNFVISFSLFSHQTSEGFSLNDSSPSCSTTGPNPRVIPFNNLFITGCLTTFVLQLYSPQLSSLKAGGPVIEKKEALSLTLGQALVHFSRKSVMAPVKARPATSVDDYTANNKMQVSGS